MHTFAANLSADGDDFKQYVSGLLNMVTLIDRLDLVDHRLKAYAAPVGPLPVCMLL
jgi:hypothetical protein